MAGTLPYQYNEKQLSNLMLWYEFIEDTFDTVKRFRLDTIPEESKYFAVFVDDRRHPYMEYVIRNVMYFLGKGWGLQLFVWPENRFYVESAVKDLEYVHITEMSFEEFEGNLVDDVKRRETFWSSVKGERQLFFDIDTLLCNGNVNEFLKYDYIGAPWLEGYAVSPVCRVGSGGLSLRKKEAMMDISRTTNIRPVLIAEEDIFYSVNIQLRKDKYSIPSVEEAMKFAVEGIYCAEPFGLHKAWVSLESQQLKRLLKNIHYRT
jgi:hypothetical protein